MYRIYDVMSTNRPRNRPARIGDVDQEPGEEFERVHSLGAGRGSVGWAATAVGSAAVARTRIAPGVAAAPSEVQRRADADPAGRSGAGADAQALRRQCRSHRSGNSAKAAATPTAVTATAAK